MNARLFAQQGSSEASLWRTQWLRKQPDFSNLRLQESLSTLMQCSLYAAWSKAILVSGRHKADLNDRQWGREAYAVGAEAFGWWNRNPAPRSMREGRELIGYGMAAGSYPMIRTASEAKIVLRAPFNWAKLRSAPFFISSVAPGAKVLPSISSLPLPTAFNSSAMLMPPFGRRVGRTEPFSNVRSVAFAAAIRCRNRQQGIACILGRLVHRARQVVGLLRAAS
ncbi:hypothetical protein [Mesorhizobium sp. M1396]|uniref:hypothetical protein n=1 Tax=Mesorhizobium sp. M1396 TaxID=2957095 RepID=UPI0033384811